MSTWKSDPITGQRVSVGSTVAVPGLRRRIECAGTATRSQNITTASAIAERERREQEERDQLDHRMLEGNIPECESQVRDSQERERRRHRMQDHERQANAITNPSSALYRPRRDEVPPGYYVQSREVSPEPRDRNYARLREWRRTEEASRRHYATSEEICQQGDSTQKLDPHWPYDDDQMDEFRWQMGDSLVLRGSTPSRSGDRRP